MTLAPFFDDVRVFDGVAVRGVVDVLVEGERITHVGAVDLDTLPPGRTYE
jgi:hypothetical protein